MSTPKQHHSKGRVKRKRYLHKESTTPLQACPNCGTMTMPHRACSNCGQYRGREVVDVMKKAEKNKK